MRIDFKKEDEIIKENTEKNIFIFNFNLHNLVFELLQE